MEVDPSVIAQLHNQLVPDLENSDDSASDEEDLCWEWEAVSHTSVSCIRFCNAFQAIRTRLTDACIHGDVYT